MKQFIQPFADLLKLPAQREHASDYVGGLVSDLERKNIESIAYQQFPAVSSRVSSGSLYSHELLGGSDGLVLIATFWSIEGRIW